MSKNTHAPETTAIHEAYNAHGHNAAIKIPLYNSSTFKFNSAEEGKSYFAHAYGLNPEGCQVKEGYIYSRISNPNMDLLEKRMARLDKMESGAAFASGMAAISTTLLSFLRPGDCILFSEPVYGGTHHFITETLKTFGIHAVPFHAHDSQSEIVDRLLSLNLKPSVIYVESPTNPTNDVFDLTMCAALAKDYSTADKKTLLICDNTYMGPVWSQPVNYGADIVLYSATKYLGGHSDLIAGVVTASAELIGQIKGMRSFLGCIPSPETCQNLTKSLETLYVRVESQTQTAKALASYLKSVDMVTDLIYPNCHKGSHDNNDQLFNKQFSGEGSMISFRIQGSEKEAFAFLNKLSVFQLAVSLGSTESLVQHPYSMTHAGVPVEDKLNMGITDNLIRLSVGLEHQDDLLHDLEQAFEALQNQWVVGTELSYN